MDWLHAGFSMLQDFRSPCSCFLGEEARRVLLVDELGHHYGFYFGEAICFAFHAQRKLFQHVLGSLFCFFSLIAGFGRTGPLPDFVDSWSLLVLDIPRVAIVLFGLSLLHRLLRFCCGTPVDQYGMGARLMTLRAAESDLKQRRNKAAAIEALVKTSRKLEFDRLFEFLLISPRWIWNG
jgi:hypothetical protein